MAELKLRMTDGSVLALPASLNVITTYVILEQEAWFEKEPAFVRQWLKPGMIAIDIGANYGVYSIPMARRVDPGRVFAYEPASEPRGFLEKSRALNRLTNLDVFGAAMSDAPRQGHLVLGTSSELNYLASDAGAGGETVTITCLDAENELRAWDNVDFIKIDAEGEEERIIAGGERFFTRHSPLVMFETRAGGKENTNLRAAFLARGYNIYRLLPGAPMLVPMADDEPAEVFELNLFAAKPDRAAALAHDDLLVQSVVPFTIDDAARARALDLLRSQPCASAFPNLLMPDVAIDPVYRDALAAYAVWRSPDNAPAKRHGALSYALGALISLCQRDASPPRLSTAARVAWEAGRRIICLEALRGFVVASKGGDSRLNEPFWPPGPRFDAIAPGPRAMEWLAVSVFEQLESAAGFSSLYGNFGIDRTWLGGSDFASREMTRRDVLCRARAGQRVEVPARLRAEAPDNLNAQVWRDGLVPNTYVR